MARTISLVAKGKAEQYNSIEKVNLSSVRVGVNIGGTNTRFLRMLTCKTRKLPTRYREQPRRFRNPLRKVKLM
ncbi:hypothetical protein O9929_20750 [Vibrio lentus]|nr:hypothetical protein [Vibrio lentus]